MTNNPSDQIRPILFSKKPAASKEEIKPILFSNKGSASSVFRITPEMIENVNAKAGSNFRATQEVVDRYNSFDKEISEAAKKKGEDANLIKYLMLQESRMRPGQTSPAGYYGLAQTDQGTIDMINNNYKTNYTLADMDDPQRAAEFMADYIKLAKRFGAEDWGDFVVGYNRGIGKIKDHKAGADHPEETQKYLATAQAFKDSLDEEKDKEIKPILFSKKEQEYEPPKFTKSKQESLREKFAQTEIDRFEKYKQDPRLLMGVMSDERDRYKEYLTESAKLDKYEISEEEREEARQIKPYLTEMEKETDERIKEIAPKASRKGFSVLGGTEVTNVENKSEADKELTQLRQKKRIIRDTKRYNDFVAEGDKLSGLERAWVGMKDWDTASIVTAGISEALQGRDMAVLANKLMNEGEDALTQDEKDALVLYHIGLYAQETARQDRAFAVGSGLVETVPFIMSMIATSGVGTSIRKGTSKVVQRYTQNEIARKLVSNLTDATFRAFMFPMTYEEMSRRVSAQVAYDENMNPVIVGEGEDFMTAMGKSVGVSAIEIFSEGAVGNGLSKVMNKMTTGGRKILQGTKMGDIYRAVERGTRSVRQVAGVHSPFIEFNEEIFAGVTQPIITGEGSPLDFFEYENMLRTAMIVSTMSVMMNAPNAAVGIHKMHKIQQGKKVYDSLDDEAKAIFREMVLTDSFDDDVAFAHAIRLRIGDAEKEKDNNKLVLKNNRDLIRLNNYSAAIRKARMDSEKIEGASYQFGSELFDNSEEFFKEVDRAIKKGSPIPYVNVRNDDAAQALLDEKVNVGVVMDKELNRSYREIRRQVSGIPVALEEAFEKELNKNGIQLEEGQTIHDIVDNEALTTPEKLRTAEQKQFVEKVNAALTAFTESNIERLKEENRRIKEKDLQEQIEFNESEQTRLKDQSKIAQEKINELKKKDTLTQEEQEELSDLETIVSENQKKLTEFENNLPILKQKITRFQEQKPEAKPVDEKTDAEKLPEKETGAQDTSTEKETGKEEKPQRKPATKPRNKKVTPKSMEDLEKIGREMFGLDEKKAKVFATVADRMIRAQAKRAKMSVEQMYATYDFVQMTPKQLEKFIASQKAVSQMAKGAFLTKDGRRIIAALTDPNISTPLHELAHAFEAFLTQAEKKTVLKWAKAKEWNDDVSEKFAVGFEKYLQEGKAPTEELKEIFEKFKKWLWDIYNGLTHGTLELNLNDDMRRIYDSMLTGETVEKKPAEKKAEKTKPEEKGPLFQIIGEKGAAALDKNEGVTTRMDFLDRAKSMINFIAPGKEKEQKGKIKLITGWELGVDKKWKYEIPDVKWNDRPTGKNFNIQIQFLSGMPVYAGDLFGENHELFKAFPELTFLTVENRKMDDALGLYDHTNKTISIDLTQLGFPDMFSGTARGNIEQYREYFDTMKDMIFRNDSQYSDAVRSVLIHELQHAVQRKEGFARGGSPESAIMHLPNSKIMDLLEKTRSYLTKEYNRLEPMIKGWKTIELNYYRWANKNKDKVKELESNIENIKSINEKIISKGMTGASVSALLTDKFGYALKNKAILEEFVSVKDIDKAVVVDFIDNGIEYVSKQAGINMPAFIRVEQSLKKVEDTIGKIWQGDKTTLLSTINEIKKVDESAMYDAYYRLAGEVEARNAEERRSMFNSYKNYLLLEDTEKVPRSEQIVLFQGAEQKSEYNLSPKSEVLFQSVWHGSPHEFEKFSTKYMGTGEGNQTYGWGLYFTDREEIARSYASIADTSYLELIDNLDKKTKNKIERNPVYKSIIGEPQIDPITGITIYGRINSSKATSLLKNALDVLVKAKRIESKLIKTNSDRNELEVINDAIARDFGATVASQKSAKTIQDIREILDAGIFKPANRSLYKVKLHGDRSVDEFNYLRWDNTIDDRTIDVLIKNTSDDKLKDKLRSFKDYYADTKKGIDLYRLLTDHFNRKPKEASLFLLRAGIDGIKYPTEYRSKGTHEESFNYVIFDENIAEIEDKVLFQASPARKLSAYFSEQADEELNRKQNNILKRYQGLLTDALKYVRGTVSKEPENAKFIQYKGAIYTVTESRIGKVKGNVVRLIEEKNGRAKAVSVKDKRLKENVVDASMDKAQIISREEALSRLENYLTDYFKNEATIAITKKVGQARPAKRKKTPIDQKPIGSITELIERIKIERNAVRDFQETIGIIRSLMNMSAAKEFIRHGQYRSVLRRLESVRTDMDRKAAIEYTLEIIEGAEYRQQHKAAEKFVRSLKDNLDKIGIEIEGQPNNLRHIVESILEMNLDNLTFEDLQLFNSIAAEIDIKSRNPRMWPFARMESISRRALEEEEDTERPIVTVKDMLDAIKEYKKKYNSETLIDRKTIMAAQRALGNLRRKAAIMIEQKALNTEGKEEAGADISSEMTAITEAVGMLVEGEYTNSELQEMIENERKNYLEMVQKKLTDNNSKLKEMASKLRPESQRKALTLLTVRRKDLDKLTLVEVEAYDRFLDNLINGYLNPAAAQLEMTIDKNRLKENITDGFFANVLVSPVFRKWSEKNYQGRESRVPFSRKMYNIQQLLQKQIWGRQAHRIDTWLGNFDKDHAIGSVYHFVGRGVSMESLTTKKYDQMMAEADDILREYYASTVTPGTRTVRMTKAKEKEYLRMRTWIGMVLAERSYQATDIYLDDKIDRNNASIMHNNYVGTEIEDKQAKTKINTATLAEKADNNKKRYMDNKQRYNDLMEFLRENGATKEVDGIEIMDTFKAEQLLRQNDAVNRYIQTIENVLDDMKGMAQWSTFANGRSFSELSDYYPFVVIQEKKVLDTDRLRDAMTLQRKPAKMQASATYERSGATNYLQVDPMAVMTKYIEEIARNYHVYGEMRKALAAISESGREADKGTAPDMLIGNLTRAILADIKLRIDMHYGLNSFSTSEVSNAMRRFSKAVKVGLLAKITRPVAEFPSNISRAAISLSGVPVSDILEAAKHKDTYNSLIEDFIGEKYMSRFGEEVRGKAMKGKLSQKMEEYARYIVTFSDTTVGRPLFVSEFRRNFKKLTGNDFDAAQYKASINYMVENSEAIEKAATRAVRKVEELFNEKAPMTAPSFIRFWGGLWTVKRNSFAAEYFGFLMSFSRNEASQFMDSVRRMKHSPLQEDKEQAGRDMAAIIFSNAMYGVLRTASLIGLEISFQFMYNLLPGDDKDDPWLRERKKKLATFAFYKKKVAAATGELTLGGSAPLTLYTYKTLMFVLDRIKIKDKGFNKAKQEIKDFMASELYVKHIPEDFKSRTSSTVSAALPLPTAITEEMFKLIDDVTSSANTIDVLFPALDLIDSKLDDTQTMQALIAAVLRTMTLTAPNPITPTAQYLLEKERRRYSNELKRKYGEGVSVSDIQQMWDEVHGGDTVLDSAIDDAEAVSNALGLD